METTTANALITLLQSLMNNAHESALRLMALEGMLKDRPELNQEYQKQLAQIGGDPTTSTNLQNSSRLLGELRARLLQG
jgi:hypothetical protein